MIIVGILITIVAIFMILFPEFFMKLKSPRIPEKLLKSPKIKIIIRVWGSICIIIGIILIIFAIN